MSDIIKITMGKMQMALDGEVMKAVQNVGIDVDKDKLLEALQLADTLVRCKECKFREANKSIYRGAWYCSNHGDTVDLDDYCSYGERKSDE